MRLTAATVFGIAAGCYLTLAIHRHLPAFLWWAFSRGDAR